MNDEFYALTVIAEAFKKTPAATMQLLPVANANCNSRTIQALELHSCRALSSWSHRQSTSGRDLPPSRKSVTHVAGSFCNLCS